MTRKDKDRRVMELHQQYLRGKAESDRLIAAFYAELDEALKPKATNYYIPPSGFGWLDMKDEILWRAAEMAGCACGPGGCRCK